MGLCQSRAGRPFSDIHKNKQQHTNDDKHGSNAGNASFHRYRTAAGHSSSSSPPAADAELVELPATPANLIFSIAFAGSSCPPSSSSSPSYRLFSGDSTGFLRCFDSCGPGASLSAQTQAHDNSIQRILVNDDTQGDGCELFTASRDHTIKRWLVSPSSSSCSLTLRGHSLVVAGLAKPPNSAGQLVSGSRDYSVRWWDLSSGQCVSRRSVALNMVTDLAPLVGRDQCVVQTSEDLTLRVWDGRVRGDTPALKWNDGPYFSLGCAVSGDFDGSAGQGGDLIITTHNGFNGDGCQVKVWDIRNGGDRGPVKEFSCSIDGGESFAHSEAVYQARFLDAAHWITCAKDATIKVWNINNDKCVSTINMDQDYSPLCVSVSNPLPGLSLVACGSSGGLVSVWALEQRDGQWNRKLIAQSKRKQQDNDREEGE